MQFCIQTTKSCEERSIELWARTDGRLAAGGGAESGEEESAERSLVPGPWPSPD